MSCTESLLQHMGFLVVIFGIFICSMWALVPWPGFKPVPPAMRVHSLSHWTTKEVPHSLFHSLWNMCVLYLLYINFNQMHFKHLIATCGYHIGQSISSSLNWILPVECPSIQETQIPFPITIITLFQTSSTVLLSVHLEKTHHWLDKTISLHVCSWLLQEKNHTSGLPCFM